MAPKLYLSPNQDTTRKHVVEQIGLARQCRPLSTVRLLLPSGEAIRQLQRNLGNNIGLQLFQFYGLGRWILNQAGAYPGDAGDVLPTRLVKRVLEQMRVQGQLTSFISVWDKPGFTHMLVEWIREMKSQGIPPERVQEQARASGAKRDAQLSTIYQHYQAFLVERDLSDADGLLWLAAEALEADQDLARSGLPFLIFGFDHFNPLQLRILKQLARRLPNFSIYLPWDAARGPDSLALYRLGQTRAALESELSPAVYFLEDTAPPVLILKHLSSAVFEHGAVKVQDVSPPAVRAVSAPSREVEMRHALRQIKRLLLEGVAPHDIALLAPSPGIYHSLARSVSDEYGIPLQLSQTGGESPVIAALALMLSLAPDFPRREMLDALRSPYIRQAWLSTEQVELLDRLSRERPVLRGLEQWQFALRPLDPGEPGYEEEERGGPQLARRLGAEILRPIQDGLLAFCEHLTPPAAGSYAEYALWVQESILGIFPEPEDTEAEPISEIPPSLNMAGCCQENDKYAARDLNALSMVLRALRELVEAGRILAPEQSNQDRRDLARKKVIGQADFPDFIGSTDWYAFRDELLELLFYASLPPDRGRSCVRFGPLNAARDAPCRHLFVLGMSEGEFPRPPIPDVFYSPQEREQFLQGDGLPLRQVNPAEDASLWWQVIRSATTSLTLLRPRLDENGAPWLPSPFWESLFGLVEGEVEEEIPIAAPPRVEQAACHSELLVALAASGARRVPALLQKGWEKSLRCHAVTRTRQSWGEPGIYEGFLAASDLRTELANHFGPKRSWSASRLNRYGSCPFGFFAEYVLELEAQPDPEEGFDAMQQGSLLHAVLEQTYAILAKARLSLTESNQELVLEQLSKTCQVIFESAPKRYGFRPGSLWVYEQNELKRMLEALLCWECSENKNAASFRPYQQEVGFGLPGSQLPALVLEDLDGCRYQVYGVIDRVDRDETGNLRVIDYKSGSTSYSPADIEKGLACQTALYALAAEPLLPPGARVVESCYLLIPSRKSSGGLHFDGPVIENETVRSAVDMALAFIRFVRRAEFPSLPGKPTRGLACRDSCDFSGLCRVSRQGMAKARRRTAA